MVVPAAIQLNPNTYDDPLAFNPWRWKVYIIYHFYINFRAKKLVPLGKINQIKNI